MKTMKYYLNLYIKCDAIMFTDAFEKFRNRCLEDHGLCPGHYFCAPVISWDAMLGMTNVERDLISRTGMYLFFEKGIRGGVFHISKR